MRELSGRDEVQRWLKISRPTAPHTSTYHTEPRCGRALSSSWLNWLFKSNKLFIDYSAVRPCWATTTELVSLGSIVDIHGSQRMSPMMFLLGPDWKISTNIRWIVMKIGTNIQSGQVMNLMMLMTPPHLPLPPTFLKSTFKNDILFVFNSMGGPPTTFITTFINKLVFEIYNSPFSI